MRAPQHRHDREPLILVQESNRAIGTASKRIVHAKGLLHRAFSIFLVDARGRILLQRRQLTKYHSGGLWANTCCGHPQPGETTRAAARRRLREELGMSAALEFRFHARYRARLGPDMHENELVYIYFGRIEGRAVPNHEEASELDLLSLPRLRKRCAAQPAAFTVWLRHYLTHHYEELALAVRDL